MPSPSEIARAEEEASAPEAVPANGAEVPATKEQQYAEAAADAAKLRLTIAHRERELTQLRSRLQETEAVGTRLLQEITGTLGEVGASETARGTDLQRLMEELDKKAAWIPPYHVGPYFK